MDTSEDRQKQVEFFKPAEEEELWPLIIDHMHPFWVENGQIQNKALFSPGAYVEVNFAEQLPLIRRGEMVKDLEAERDAGFIMTRDCIAKLNPQWDETEVDAYAARVQAERDAKAPDTTPDGEPVDEDEKEDDTDDAA